MNLRWRIAQFFERHWWRFYLYKKDKAAYLAWKKAYWLRFLEQTGMPLQANQRILDMGCGPAGIFIVLDQYAVDAVDPLLDVYATDLPHFDPKDWHYVRFITQTLEQFEAKQPYPTIFCINAINHVANLPAALDRLVQLLEPGGQLAFSIDAHNYSLLKEILRRIPGDILHPHQYDLAEYSAMLTRRGLHVERSILIKKELIFNYYLLVASKSAE